MASQSVRNVRTVRQPARRDVLRAALPIDAIETIRRLLVPPEAHRKAMSHSIRHVGHAETAVAADDCLQPEDASHGHTATCGSQSQPAGAQFNANQAIAGMPLT